MKTPDPTPVPLPPAHLAEIRARARLLHSEGAAWHAVDDRRALLAHLDALTPRAPVDGEALGREARASHMDWSEDTASVWPFLTEKVRGDYCRTAIHVHAIGYAARASEGEALPYICPCCYHQRGDEVPADGRSTREEMAATIARLTAELAEARAAVEAFRALPGYPHTEGVTPAMVKLRLEANGAREERDAILHDIYALPGAREYSGERATIVRAIRSRATEGRQG